MTTDSLVHQQRNLHPIPTLRRHLRELNVLLHLISAFNLLILPQQSHKHIRRLAQSLLLRGADPRPAHERQKFPLRLQALEAARVENLDVWTPDVGVVVLAPEVERHYRAFGDEYWGCA